ncbi:helix-turn-helix domain-containing protein [Shivajiella indica]|uniref:Helix-turn-helix domain-containing protein n=1 Tax=Shivajiella indica TaxID=872115 RepID=A0ABW5B6R0_9BACT
MGQYKNKEFLRSIGLKIESIRTSKGLTHEILAERMGLNDVRQVGRVINAETNFSSSEIFRFSVALGVQPKDLFDFEIELREEFIPPIKKP